MTTFDTLRGAVTGDIHCAHPRVSTLRIISALENVFMKKVREDKLNFIMFNGDFYDGLVSDTNPDKLLAKSFFVKTLLYCRENNITVRCLKGTPSHDHDQLKSFEAIANGISGLDFRYIDTVYVEYHPRYAKYFLYIPDEWSHHCDDTYRHVLNVLSENNIERVDYGFVHGQFDYQLGDIIPQRLKHKLSDYIKIVTKKIFCNHIHVHSEKGIVIAPGSLERLSQGEEGPKGFVVFEDNSDGCSCTFVHNTESVKHITIHLRDTDLGLALEYINKKISTAKLKDEDCLRIVCDKDNPLRYSKPAIQKFYPNIRISIETKTDKKQTHKTVLKKTTQILNAQTVAPLVEQQLIRNGVENNIIKACMELLEDALQSTR